MGEIAIAVMGSVTLKLAWPVGVPSVALIVVDPWPTPVASPFVPAVLLIVATFVSVELQVAVVVRSCVLPSL